MQCVSKDVGPQEGGLTLCSDIGSQEGELTLCSVSKDIGPQEGGLTLCSVSARMLAPKMVD